MKKIPIIPQELDKGDKDSPCGPLTHLPIFFYYWIFFTFTKPLIEDLFVDKQLHLYTVHLPLQYWSLSYSIGQVKSLMRHALRLAPCQQDPATHCEGR